MAEKKYYWLKLKNDFFNSREMKKLRKIAGGDTYTIIYLKLQLLSLAKEGMLHFDGIEETFAEELALDIDEDPDNVQATLIFLQKCKLAEIVADDEIFLTQVPESLGKEGESAERMRRMRAKTSQSDAKALQSDASVTKLCGDVQKSDTEIDIDIDIDIDKDKEREKDKEKAPSGRGGLAQTINSVSSPSLREALTEYARMREKMKAPLTDYAMKLVIDQVEQMANDEATRVAIINQSIKNGWKDLFPLETKPKKKNAVGAFGNYEQRNLDYSEVEKKIRGYK